jgi:hypothetical protein
MGKGAEGMQGRGRPRIEREEHMQKLTRKREKT